MSGGRRSEVGSLDLFTQARKALSDRSPFDLEDGQEVSTGNLPREFANLLSKRSDGRKRHKKSHSAGESKSQRLEKSRAAVFWAGKEAYFRGLTVADIDKLSQLSTFEFSSTSESLLIPFLKNGETGGVVNAYENGNVSGAGDHMLDVEQVEDKCDEHEQLLVDSARTVVELNGQDKDTGLKRESSGFEWLLGSRNKIYLTSERPSKKRKLLGGDAGLDKLIVSPALEGSSSSCHYCGFGDTGDQLNRLMVCSTCNVAVHQRCYGVQEDDVSESWLCSWCDNRNHRGTSDRPCLLCPKQGGALKPVQRGDNSGSMEFAHLFCCQWMPELYVEDTRRMEPIMNFEGIKETRHKLICRLCKIRWGACVRCSNGTCRASFHPICAREARQRMEIWGKFGSDDVELRAFCSKHSEDHNNISSVEGDQSLLSSTDPTITKHQPVSSTMIKPHKIKINRRNGEAECYFETSELDLDKADRCVPREVDLPDARLNLTNDLECRGTQHPDTALIVDKISGEDVDTTESSNYKTILKKLIDQRKVNMNDVASEIGVSPELLASNLIGDNLVPELQNKIVEWMKNHAFTGPSQRNLKVRFKNPTKVEAVANDGRILKDGKALCSTRASSNEDGISMTHKSARHLIRDEPACQSEESVPDNSLKILLEPAGSQDILPSNSSKIEGEGSKLSYCTAFGSIPAVEGAIPEKNPALDSVANPVCVTAVNCVPDLM